MIKQLQRYFQFEKYQTTWRTEIMAGVATYLSLAYIFIVNPAILSKAGMNISAVLFATVFVSGVTTIVMGSWAKLPFCVAPGLEMDGFFAFTVVGLMGLSWQEALGAVFWSGVLCMIFSIARIRHKIVDSIPEGLKKSLSVGVAFFVLTIAFYLAGIVKFSNGVIDINSLAFGHFNDPKFFALLIGLAICVVLGIERLKFHAGMLVAIILVAIYCKFNNIVVTNPVHLSKDMISEVWALKFFPSSLKFIPVFLVFFLIDFYGSIGKFIGLTASTSLVDKDGKLPNLGKALYVDGGGTVASGLFGTSSVITYVESAVGIQMGGRTGVVAIVCGILMLCSLVFTPLVGLVPVEATSGVLVYVGYLLVKTTWKEKTLQSVDLFIMGIMIVTVLLTFNLGQAMALGFTAYCIKQVIDALNGKGKVNFYFLVSTLAIDASIALQLYLS